MFYPLMIDRDRLNEGNFVHLACLDMFFSMKLKINLVFGRCIGESDDRKRDGWRRHLRARAFETTTITVIMTITELNRRSINVEIFQCN
jgi:hypothetical protein